MKLSKACDVCDNEPLLNVPIFATDYFISGRIIHWIMIECNEANRGILCLAIHEEDSQDRVELT